MRSPEAVRCPVSGNTTPILISPLLSSVCWVVGSIICGIRSQAEKHTNKAAIVVKAKIDLNLLFLFNVLFHL